MVRSRPALALGQTQAGFGQRRRPPWLTRRRDHASTHPRMPTTACSHALARGRAELVKLWPPCLVNRLFLPKDGRHPLEGRDEFAPVPPFADATARTRGCSRPELTGRARSRMNISEQLVFVIISEFKRAF